MRNDMLDVKVNYICEFEDGSDPIYSITIREMARKLKFSNCNNLYKYMDDGKFHKGRKFSTNAKNDNPLLNDPNFSSDNDNEFVLKKSGEIKHQVTNYVNFLSTYEPYKDNLFINQMSNEIYLRNPDTDTMKMVDESVKIQMELDMEGVFDYNKIDSSSLEKAIKYVGLKQVFHPIKNHIEREKWDGVKRAETIFIESLDCEDNYYNRTVTKMFLYNAVKRIYSAYKDDGTDGKGCKFDICTILLSTTQGIGKSTLIDKLSFNSFTNITDINDESNWMSGCNQNWFGVFEEFDFNKTDLDKLKKDIASKEFKTRLKYRRDQETFINHNVFIAATNKQYLLKDYTSDFERRFAIVECGSTIRQDSDWWKKIDSDKKYEDFYFHQLWAEVKTWYDEHKNDDNYLCDLDKECKKILKEIQYRHKSCYKDAQAVSLIDIITSDDFKIDNDCRTQLFKWKKFLKTLEKDGECFCQNPCEMKMIPHSWMCNYFAGKGEFYFDPLFNKHGWERKEIMYYDNKITDCFILPNYKPSGQVKQTILYDDITRDIENGNF